MVAPVFQIYMVPPEAVRFVDSPTQMTLSPVIITVGKGLTITVSDVVAVHPFMSVTVSEYVVFEIGFTVMEGVMAPLLQRFEIPPVPVKVVDWPVQISLSPVMSAMGSGLTVMVVIPVEEQLFPSVTVTK